MAYNYYKDLENVYNAKVAYGNATTDEERNKQNQIATKAREALAKNGYSTLADSISASGATAEDVRKLMPKYAKTDKTATRPYLYSLGQKYGMSQSDIDKLIGWDADSGQVSFGGKVIGTPDAAIDGVSYWSDTSKLDDAFNDYISRTGITRSNEMAINQENEDLFAKYRQTYDDLTKTNPFTTEEAKAILAKYDLSGLQARDNAVASGGASNGGNIDSYAAANAMRQQASLVNQGQMAVLESHQQKIDNVRGLLSDMGVNIDRVFNQNETVKNREFEQSETAKNNEAARQELYSNISGTVGDTVTKALHSNIWNSDGSLVNPNQDFMASMKELEDAYKATTDEEARARIWDQLRVLEAARNQKIDEQGLGYAKTYTYQSDKQTEAGRQFDKQDKTARDSLTATNNLAKYEIDANAKIAQDQIEAEKEINKDKLDTEKELTYAQIGAEKEIAATKATSSTGSSGGSGGSKGGTGGSSGGNNGGNAYAPYTNWNADGITLQNVSIVKPNDYASKLSESKVDQFGQKAIESVYAAAANGQLDGDKDGQVTNYELADFLIVHSNDNDTDKKQLKQVFAYFGIPQTLLDSVQDVGKGKNLSGSDFKYGVEYIN